MRLQILKDTTESIEIVLEGAVTTNELDWTASYFDEASGTQTLGSSNGVSNGTTDVVVVAAPSGSDVRVVKEITVFNADTVDATVTIKFVDGASERIIEEATLSPGSTYAFSGTASSGGGTTSPLTTKGDLYTYDSDNARLPVGTDGQHLVPNSAVALGIEWADVTPSPTTTYPGTAITVNSSAKTTWFTHALPAMGTLDSVRVWVSYRFLNTVGSGQKLTLTIDLGASTPLVVALHNLASNAAPFNGFVEFTVSALSSTSSQITKLKAQYARATESSTTMTTPTINLAFNTTSENLSTTKNLVVSGTLEVAHASLEMQFLGAVVVDIS